MLFSDNQLFEKSNQLKAENVQLTIENEKLRMGGNSGGSGDAAVRIQAMEKKLLAQQEELTDLHKRKGDNSQMIIDLNLKVAELQKLLNEKTTQLAEQITVNNSVKAEVQMLTNNIQELKNLNSMLRDEYTALQLSNSTLEEKLVATQKENTQLVERLIKYKAKDAEKMNEENESFLK